MYIKYLSGLIFAILLISPAVAQPPGGRMGPPPGAGPMPGPGNGPGQPGGDWIKPLDSNQNQRLEIEELQTAIDRTFAEFDRNANGTIEPGEAKFRPDGGMPPRGVPNNLGPRPQGPPPDGKRLLPPFFFKESLDRNEPLTKADFDRNAKEIFKQMDRNGDGVVDKAESRPPNGPDRGPGPHGPPMPPNAQFIGAELRFGDKLVKGQPFSAETVIEDTRRLFDGSTVTKSRRGSIYRDGDGRTRREQPMEIIAGVNIAGNDNKPQMLVFINDFTGKSQIFLDITNKVARKTPIGNFPAPGEPGQPADAKTEALGTKTIEGIKAEGTRTTFEIPPGQIGNDKPIEVVTEKWFSPELQVVVMSRHVDPIAGEHVFKLVNIRRAEPSAELFAIPAGFRVDNPPGKRPE